MGKTSGPSRSELLKGTLDMLILQTLTMQPLHGYAIAQQIELLSDAVLTVEQGSLYPCLLYTSPSPRDGLLSRMPSSA